MHHSFVGVCVLGFNRLLAANGYIMSDNLRQVFVVFLLSSLQQPEAFPWTRIMYIHVGLWFFQGVYSWSDGTGHHQVWSRGPGQCWPAGATVHWVSVVQDRTQSAVSNTLTPLCNAAWYHRHEMCG